MTELTELQETWKELYARTLPKLAKAKDPAQPQWPVTLDHCFARIILDNAIGEGRQWDQVISKPAVKNMTESQLKAAIELGERIKSGKANLVELDRQSLEARGKSEHKYNKANGVKRKAEDVEIPRKRKSSKQTTLPFANDAKSRSSLERELDVTSSLTPEDMRKTLKRIDDSEITAFRKRLYTSLLSVPLGQFTTYAALAEHLGSAARAVGNGMRNNPFAPDVPCHRVLASDGTLGGFFGQWERDKKGPKGYAPKQKEKVELLQKEGVEFDSVGKVKGVIWRGFWDRDDFDKHLEVSA